MSAMTTPAGGQARTAAEFDRLDDDALVARVQGGDRDAFAILVKRHQRAIYGVAYRILGHPADAEDAAQETFVRAYTRLDTYTPDGRFGAWVGAICAHWCIDALRARRRRVQTVALGKVPESERFISPGDGPEDAALGWAARDEMQCWLDRLGPQHRTVLMLRYVHDLSYAEIAAVLGEPVSTVRMRLFRARARLYDVVAQEHIAPARRRRSSAACIA